MSNDAGFEISVKHYAEVKNKTVQAVYQQMKRPGNAAALEGHVFTKRVGNKNVKYLDEEAVRILDEGRAAAPVIVQQDEYKAKYEEASSLLEVAEKRAAFQEGKIEMLKELLAEKESKLLALAEPGNQIEDLKRQNDDLSVENSNLVQSVQDEIKTREDVEMKLKTLVSGSWSERRRLRRELKRENKEETR